MTLAAQLKGLLMLIIGSSLGLLFLLPMLLLALLKAILPGSTKLCTPMLINLAQSYIRLSHAIYYRLYRPDWQLDIDPAINPQEGCVVICNHQSWTDIPLLIFALHQRVPFPTFFLKEELRWVPLIGWAAWALDYPFLRRHSAEAIAQNPALREEDARSTAKSCAKLKNRIPCLINFAEGTRFTHQKQQQTASPYQHLLRPKAGALNYALMHLQDQIPVILDATLIYQGTTPGFWRFLCGKPGAVELQVKRLTVPARLKPADKESGERLRAETKNWLEQRWLEKDQLIELRLSRFTVNPR